MKYVYTVNFSWSHSSDEGNVAHNGLVFGSKRKAMNYYRSVTNDYDAPLNDTGIIAQAPADGKLGGVAGYYSVRKVVVR